MLAAFDSLSLRTFPKKASSLLTKNFSIESSCSEFFAFNICSFWTNSDATPPSASVNWRAELISKMIRLYVTNRSNSLIKGGIGFFFDNG